MLIFSPSSSSLIDASGTIASVTRSQSDMAAASVSNVSVTIITGGRPTYPARMAMTSMTDYDSM